MFAAALDAGAREVVSALQGQSQQGMVRLIGCLGDARDEIKNEVLLLLTRLVTATRSDAIKSMVVFNEGFDRIMDMMDEDGGVREGSIVTQDCLRLLNHLVDGSAIIQRQFCELEYLRRMAPSLDLPTLLEGQDEDESTGLGGAPILRNNQREGLHLELTLLRLLVRARRARCTRGCAKP